MRYMNVHLLMAIALLAIAPIAHAQTTGKQLKDSGMTIIPVAPGSTVRPLGNGAIVTQPNQKDTHVQPLGNGMTIRQDGKPDVRCYPLGNHTVCR
jgi:hypothetical protein